MFLNSEEDLIEGDQWQHQQTRDRVGGSNISGVSNENQSKINSRTPGSLRVDQRSINYGVQVQGIVSKIRRRFDKRPGTGSVGTIDLGIEMRINC